MTLTARDIMQTNVEKVNASMPLVELDTVRFQYPGTATRLVLDGVSLSLEEGERIALLMEKKGLAYDTAFEMVRASNVFTTHTPVPAGNEIFDGDPPHKPCGTIAQAWSVSELLRAWNLTEPG